MFNERGQWTAAVHVDVSVITEPCQGLRSVGPRRCAAAVLYV